MMDVQMLSYLKYQPEGEANRTIDGFALTNTNYARATQLLREKCGQKHKIIHATKHALVRSSLWANNKRLMAIYSCLCALKTSGKNGKTSREEHTVRVFGCYATYSELFTTKLTLWKPDNTI